MKIGGPAGTRQLSTNQNAVTAKRDRGNLDKEHVKIMGSGMGRLILWSKL
jgi:hypothetical protein